MFTLRGGNDDISIHIPSKGSWDEFPKSHWWGFLRDRSWRIGVWEFLDLFLEGGAWKWLFVIIFSPQHWRNDGSILTPYFFNWVSSRELTYPIKNHVWVDDFPNFPFGGICIHSLGPGRFFFQVHGPEETTPLGSQPRAFQLVEVRFGLARWSHRSLQYRCWWGERIVRSTGIAGS